jgi:hypothetical protein
MRPSAGKLAASMLNGFTAGDTYGEIPEGAIVCRQRLGGLFKHYCRKAA